jgi:large subunit ribosomal protein L1
MKRGKKYTEKAALVEANQAYSPDQAMSLVKQTAYAKFPESVEIHFKLGIDPRHADQQIRGTLSLPHGTGKSIRVAVVASPDKQDEAKKAGADEVGGAELVDKIAGGWFEFDLLIATPDMMAKVGRLGQVLGPKGLMPSPKGGTVTPQVGQAVKEFKSGRIEYRNDKLGNLHVVIGKVNFAENQLVENYWAVHETVVKARPSKAKGVYMQSITACSTMGPGVSIDPLKNKKEG